MKTETKTLDLKTFKFPKVSGADMVFPTFDTIPELLKEAEDRGLDNWNHPYHELFSNLFFSGGDVVFKKDLDAAFKKAAWSYCIAFMASYAPKHEHKGAICALLMSELLELPNP